MEEIRVPGLNNRSAHLTDTITQCRHTHKLIFHLSPNIMWYYQFKCKTIWYFHAQHKSLLFCHEYIWQLSNSWLENTRQHCLLKQSKLSMIKILFRLCGILFRFMKYYFEILCIFLRNIPQKRSILNYFTQWRPSYNGNWHQNHTFYAIRSYH